MLILGINMAYNTSVAINLKSIECKGVKPISSSTVEREREEGWK
jgi:hypothetical protein